MHCGDRPGNAPGNARKNAANAQHFGSGLSGTGFDLELLGFWSG
jgi:hypothetical protein